jgi:hypothetical protein
MPVVVIVQCCEMFAINGSVIVQSSGIVDHVSIIEGIITLIFIAVNIVDFQSFRCWSTEILFIPKMTTVMY